MRERAIVLAIQKQPDANTVAVVDSVLAKLPALRAAIPPSVTMQVMMDRSVYEGFNGLVAKTYPTENRDAFFVDIVGLDKQADGGTHVRSTAEVGRLRVLKLENKGKGNKRVRVEIVDA